MPSVDNSKGEHEAYCLPRNNGRICIPVIHELDGSVTTSIKSGLPLDDFPNGVPLALHGPYHGKALFMRRDVFGRKDGPMATSNVIMKFLVHGNKKIITVGLTEGFGDGHCVRISGDTGENMLTHQRHRVWFSV